jgi:acetylornithine deacetylase
VPLDCEFLVDVRTLPGMNFETIYSEIQSYAASLVPHMRKTAPEAGIDFEFICTVPSFDVDAAAEIVKLGQRLARSDRLQKVSFGTEAGLFKSAGIPTVILGPGDIDDAHRPNESVALAQLAQAELFMQRMIEHDALLMRQ